MYILTVFCLDYKKLCEKNVFALWISIKGSFWKQQLIMISILVVQRKYASFKLKVLNDYYGD